MSDKTWSLSRDAEDQLVSLFAESARLPKGGDRFFISSPTGASIDSRYSRSIFDKPGDPNFLLYKDYVFAHKAAAYVLLGAVATRDIGARALSSLLRQQNDDRLVFPILMCVHQHLELLIKLVLHWIKATFVEGEHSLGKLWASVVTDRPDLIWGPAGTGESVSCLLAEFDQVTQNGFGGRYPFNTQRAVTYLENIESIDLLNLLCRTENLSHYFNEILGALEQENGVRGDV